VEAKSSGAGAKSFRFSKPCAIFLSNRGRASIRGGFVEKMNAREEIRDHLLVRRMKYWRDIARCPLINTKVPTWRARKNFWSLVRRHPALAAAHGLTAASVF